jgi:hypothetical protein
MIDLGKDGDPLRRQHREQSLQRGGNIMRARQCDQSGFRHGSTIVCRANLADAKGLTPQTLTDPT